MRFLDKEVFVCLDCETTGLDSVNDRVIEVAAVKFTLHETVEKFETLIDPQCLISASSMAIHHITDQMVAGKPTSAEVLPTLLDFIGQHIIIGHAIGLDISFLIQEAKRAQIPCGLSSRETIDTLRLARLYGESPTNSLEQLRQHFNIADEGAHRAMNDVVVNIEVFKFLSSDFKTVEQLMERLKRPILLKVMPLGKHKGRPFADIPFEYLDWAVRQNFDQDLLFSLSNEIKKRKRTPSFRQAASPFSSLEFKSKSNE